MTLLAIGLQRTYNHFPLKELKRQARAGHPVAQLLYRPVSYGISLRVLLWLIIVVSATLSFVLLSRSVEPWFAIVIVGVLVWLGLFWIPSSDLTTFSIRLARLFTPVINWLLNYLDKPLHRAGEFVRRHRHINFHTGLYEKEDIADLLRVNVTCRIIAYHQLKLICCSMPSILVTNKCKMFWCHCGQ